MEGVRAEVGRIPAVDGVRGVAVLWVILFHCYVLRPADPWIVAIKGTMLDMLAGNGYLGVDLFFIISGFLLAMPWFMHASAGREPPSLRSFYVRRFWRIAPAYYVQLAVLFLVVLPLARGSAYWRSDLWVYLYNAVVHALFLHNTTPLTSGSMGMNGALWTLAVEVQFYLLLPVVMPLFVRWPKTMFVACVVLAQYWLVATRLDLDWLVNAELSFGHIWGWPESVVRYLLVHQLPAYLGHFALGIVMGRAWLLARACPAPAWALDVTAVMGALLLYWTLTINGALLGDASWVLRPLALGALLYWAASRGGALVNALLARGPLAAAGRVSYSAYLYHLPLLLLANQYLRDFPVWTVIPAYLATTAAVSWLSWRYVEQRYMGHCRLAG